MTKLLQNKVALITGGTSGIGRAIALRFAEEGARVAIIGTHLERGEALVKEVGPGSHFYPCNVASFEEVTKTVKAVIDHFGTVHILVNGAGITRDGLFLRMSDKDWNEVMSVNLNGTFHMTQALLRQMIRAREGKIINISSVVGITGNIGQVNYAASKAALFGFTKSLAKEVASRNIHVNAIAPGFIETPMTAALSEGQRDLVLSQIPLGRLGKAEEVADLALFLASTKADFITGQTFVIDGGMHMG